MKGKEVDTDEECSPLPQMVSVKACLEAIMKEVGDVKRELAETQGEARASEAKAAAAKKALSGEVNRVEEQSNNHRAVLSKTRHGRSPQLRNKPH